MLCNFNHNRTSFCTRHQTVHTLNLLPDHNLFPIVNYTPSPGPTVHHFSIQTSETMSLFCQSSSHLYKTLFPYYHILEFTQLIQRSVEKERERARMAGWWSTSTFRWLGLDFAYSSLRSSSIFRWMQFMSSSYSSTWWAPRGVLVNWDSQWFLRWSALDFSIVDDVVWSLITAFESVALVSMLCFFFVFCGCTV
ncbi:hypothetical protein MANES_09G177901v8 [Manihot esculenta]|uniref:Uncharacterized protein n=1 Tax=Manihot esculenta TaxID=3983 RepID=A0ACB7H6V5_MANES|nr:hypothetical protein MANES_09G177901v8 [Manihot esculenta]